MGCLASILALLLLPLAAGAAELQVRYPAGSFAGDFRFAYPVRLLQLALDKTAADGPARAVQAMLPMGTERIAAELERGELLDVATFPASRELERRFCAVRLCIRKGILGIRLFLVDRRRQDRLAAVEDLDGLRTLRLGQGFDWLDAGILTANGLQVVPSTTYEGLFPMLADGRFDAFPRGVYETAPEIARFGADIPTLAVEPRLALIYPLPDYFFVSRRNPALAGRLLRGLEAAVADGSYEALFQEAFAGDLRAAALDRRRIIRLRNPYIDDIPHPGDPRYWHLP